MERDVRAAARCLGASVVVTAIILVGGIHFSLSRQTDQLRQAMIEVSEKNKPKFPDSIMVKMPDQLRVQVEGGPGGAHESPIRISGSGGFPSKPIKVEVNGPERDPKPPVIVEVIDKVGK